MFEYLILILCISIILFVVYLRRKLTEADSCCNHSYLWCCDIDNLKLFNEEHNDYYRSVLICKHCGYLLKSDLTHEVLGGMHNYHFPRVSEYESK